MKSLKLAILMVPLLVLLNVLGVWAIASGLPTHDGYVYLDPEHEYWVDELQVSASNGPSGITDTQIVYMQWNLANIVSNNIHTATLTLTTTAVQDTTGATLSLHRTEDDWTEDTLTTTIGWDNKPALGEVIEEQPSPTYENQTVVFSSDALRDYIITKANSSDKVVSFALRFSSGTSQSIFAAFRSKEYVDGSGPYLLLQGPTAVKKSTLRIFGLDAQWPVVGLLVLGVLGNFARRRRALIEGGSA